ncbi:protein PIP82 isoform X2 [Eupeodes corollae]|uniref:protein PIP82 isoform X2 n=1 Tax=Eupeodes corollae TaxID=290404 RepID=UPI00249116AF|nr:protein PIP82 isoform X2 [Eupeodes corollae]
MDLKSFYKKIDVDGIKNKLPPLKIPKIKSRKIFKSSREDLAQQQSPADAMGVGSPITPQSLPGHSTFIDRTPTRISTVASLMNLSYGFKDKQDGGGLSTYKTASHFEEENCPDEFDTREPVSGNSIKNIFAKKTVVKRTEIEVDIYARQYERDIYLEERESEDHLVEQEYKFEFKEARRRLSGSSGSISPADSLRSGVPSPMRSELSHLQQNDTPPLLAKRRNAISHADALRQRLQRSVSMESNDEPPRKPNRSSLWSVNENSNAESGEEQVPVQRTTDSRLSKFKKSMKEGIREMSMDSGDDRPRIGMSMARFKKPTRETSSDGRNGPPESGDDQASASAVAPKAGPSRMARLKKSMKEGISEGFMDKNVPTESGDDQPPVAPRGGTSRMARIKKSVKDGIAEGFSDKNTAVESGDEPGSTIKPSRMARFKKSMREGISEKNIASAESGDDQPSTQKAGPSRMARFKKSIKAGIPEAIRDRHVPPESGDEQAAAPQKGVSRMARFKKSMREGISEGFSDRNIAPSSGDEQQSHKTGTSRISRIKASISERNIPTAESGDEMPKSSESRMSKFKKSMKEGMSHEFDSNWNLKGIRNRFTNDDPEPSTKTKKNLQSQESLDQHSDYEKKSWKLSNIHLRRAEPSEKTNEPGMSSPEGKFAGIKMSINRLKNRKPQRQQSEESGTDQNASESPKLNRSEQLKAGLRRLKMRERSMTFDEEETKTPKENDNISRLRNWKKSIKLKRTTQAVSEDYGEEPPPLPTSSPPGRSHTLIRKLNHIRSRKVVSEDNEESADPANDQQKQKSSNLEKLEQARTKALRKVNAQVQKMKNFHGKSRDSPSEASPEKEPRKIKKDTISKPLSMVPSSHSIVSALSLDDDDQKALPEITVRKISKSKPKLAGLGSNSMESSLSVEDTEDDDKEEDAPRVFIHQDNSDQFESTLTVAVTRPAPPVPPKTAVIKELTLKTKNQAPKTEWIPNKNAISSFLEMTPTPSPEPATKQLDVSRGHLRKRSMDSNDSDSWIPDNFRNKSCSSSSIAGLNKINENSQPWKVHSVFSEEKLYKTKSIDIFANRDGGAFRDFDDEMKNVPVRRIIADSAENLNKPYGDSTDDEEDYDNPSRVTRTNHESPMVSTKVAIETVRSLNSYDSTESNKAYRGSPVPSKKPAQIGNSQESLDANYDENDEISSEEDEDEEEEEDDEAPTMAPSPPPSFSPPPPPLPLRKPPRLVPERNESMVRLAHPLVKQGSLRRHFSEELDARDLGKVNDLITKFEKNPPYENVPRIQLIPSDDDTDGTFEVEEQKAAKTKENDAKKVAVQYSSNVVDLDDFELEDKNKTPTRENIGGGVKKTRSHRYGNGNGNGTTDEEGNFEQKKVTRSSSKRRPAPIPIRPSAMMDDSRNNNIYNNNNDDEIIRSKKEHPKSPSPEELNENLDNVSIQSPNSIYGSPIGSICLSERISTSSIYGSPVGVAYPMKTADQMHTNRRRLSNRSSLRDDDTFYSFESDEENNFYSLGDSSDMRYTIEI